MLLPGLLLWSTLVALAGTPDADLPAKHWSRLLTSEDGLPSSSCSQVIQDDTGFLWVTTAEGIARLDGARITRMTGPQTWLVVGSGTRNRFVVVDAERHLSELPVDTLRSPLGAVSSSQIDRSGRVWATAGERLAVELEPGSWTDVDGPWTGEPRLVGAASDGAVFVEAADRLLRGTERGWTVVGASEGALRAVDRGDGAVVTVANLDPAANNQGAVLSFRDGVSRSLYSTPARVIDLATRDGDLFVQVDDSVLRIDREDRVHVLSPSRCCGALLADREGGLWIASEVGLVHLPSPRTVTLPLGGTRIHPSPNGVWVPTWSGMAALSRERGEVAVQRAPVGGLAVCADHRGDGWVITRTAMTRLRPDQAPEVFPGPGFGGVFHGCAAGADERTWFASPKGLLVSDPTDPVPHPVPAVLPIPGLDGPRTTAVLEVEGTLLYGLHHQICRASVDRVLTERDPGWSCVDLPESGVLWDLERAGDVVWAAAPGLGVLSGRIGEDRWTLIPASAALRTGTLGLLAPSPRGGTWVLAEGDAIRVEEAADTPGGWRILERLGSAQGLHPGAAPRELVETATGDLWVVTHEGATTSVPASARLATVDAPPVFLSAVHTDAGTHDPTALLVLPHASNRLELHFAAPVFGSQPEYRYRLGPEEPWSKTRDAFLRFAALGTGRYAVEVEATIDGARWSAEPARFAFVVRPPWYAQPWFVLAASGALATAAFTAHRARMRFATRLARQRARIARDLHDAIGSGLGSVGLLAGIATRANGSRTTLEMVERIGELVGELGANLTDIVTSLRSGAENLRALHGHVVERGTASCAAGRPTFDSQPTDEIPAVALSVPVRINVFLVAVEAIHNAVKHAGASRISLRLEPASRGWWVLTVTDDGCGIADPSARSEGASGGVGLRSMNERAREIGAALTFTTPPGGGTEVRLRFDPGAEDRI